MTGKTSQATEMALVKQALKQITDTLAAIQASLETKYTQATETALLRLEISELRKSMVTQDQYWPVKVLVLGASGIILTGALGSILTLIYIKGT